MIGAVAYAFGAAAKIRFCLVVAALAFCPPLGLLPHHEKSVKEIHQVPLGPSRRLLQCESNEV
jgi:hypothetical protein